MSRLDARVLRDPLPVYRIGDAHGQYPIFSAEGAVRGKGRWHERGQEVIYTSRHYSTAMLETFARFSGALPSNQHYIEITIPAGTSYEIVTKDSLPRWTDVSVARAFSLAWSRIFACIADSRNWRSASRRTSVSSCGSSELNNPVSRE